MPNMLRMTTASPENLLQNGDRAATVSVMKPFFEAIRFR